MKEDSRGRSISTGKSEVVFLQQRSAGKRTGRQKRTKLKIYDARLSSSLLCWTSFFAASTQSSAFRIAVAQRFIRSRWTCSRIGDSALERLTLAATLALCLRMRADSMRSIRIESAISMFCSENRTQLVRVELNSVNSLVFGPRPHA